LGIWDPNDRTIKVDTSLKSPYFSASNGEYYNSLSSFRIFECIPRIFGVWDPHDRTVKVDTYYKSPTFSASNGKCYNSLSSLQIFQCILKVWVIKRTQKLHENSWDIFENVWIVCVECNKLDSLLDYGKEQNWQLGCHGWTVDNFLYVYKLSFLNYVETSLYLIHSHEHQNVMNDWESSVTSENLDPVDRDSEAHSTSGCTIAQPAHR